MDEQDKNSEVQTPPITEPINTQSPTTSSSVERNTANKAAVKLSWLKAILAGVSFGVSVYLIPALLALIVSAATPKSQPSGFIDGIGPAIAAALPIIFVYFLGLILAPVLCGLVLRLFRIQHPWIIALAAAIPLEAASYLFKIDMNNSLQSYSAPLLLTFLSPLVFIVLYIILIKIFSLMFSVTRRRIVSYLSVVIIAIIVFVGLIEPSKIVASDLAQKQISKVNTSTLSSAGFDIYAPTTIPNTSSIVRDSVNGSGSQKFFEIWYFDFELYQYKVQGSNYPPLNCIEPQLYSSEPISYTCTLLGQDTAGRDVYGYDPTYISDGQWIYFEKIGGNVVVLDPNVETGDTSPVPKSEAFKVLGSLEKQTSTSFQQYLLNHKQGIPE